MACDCRYDLADTCKNRGAPMNRWIGMLLLVRPRSLRLALWICVVVLAWGCRAPNAAPNPPNIPSAAEGRRGGVVRIALWQEPIILNPLIGNQVVNAVVSRTMMEGLLAPLP